MPQRILPTPPTPSHSLRLRRLVAVILTAGCLTSVATVGGAAAASPRAPRVPQAAFLSEAFVYGTETPVTSSTHLHLSAEVGTSYFADSSPARTTVSVTLFATNNAESHQWSFPVPTSDVSINSAGHGHVIVPPADISPYGTVDLTLRRVGKAQLNSCDADDYDLTQKVAITGKFAFNSHSSGRHKWGRVGNPAKRFAFRSGAEFVKTYGEGSYACHRSLNRCSAGPGFQASGESDGVFMDGEWDGKRGSIDGTRTVDLTKPAGAFRQDAGFAVSKPPKIKHQGGMARMVVSALKHTAASGSLTLTSSGAGMPETSPCKLKGQKTTETTTSWDQATAAGGKPPLTFHEAIFGNFRLKTAASSNFSVTAL